MIDKYRDYTFFLENGTAVFHVLAVETTDGPHLKHGYRKFQTYLGDIYTVNTNQFAYVIEAQLLPEQAQMIRDYFLKTLDEAEAKAKANNKTNFFGVPVTSN